MYIKRFLEWVGLKEKLDTQKSKPLFFKEGDIWWCSLGENIGVEINGKNSMFSRPLLVYKKLSSDGFLGIPLTTKDKVGTWYVPFTHGNRKMVVILSQARFVSSFRMFQKIGELDDIDFRRVREGFAELFVNKNSPGGEHGRDPKYDTIVE